MRTRITTVAIVALFTFAAPAVAATKPSVATGGTSALQPTSITLLGKVNPQGLATTYYFQYGTSKAYGQQSGPVLAGSGKTTLNATAALVGLIPHQGYHYRLVAVSSAGQTNGDDKTFTTKKQPLGLSLLAAPNPVGFGGATTVNATLTGTDRAGKTIILRQRPFPYTAPFAPVGNPEVTNSAGVAAFAILSLATNTQYQASVQGASPAVVAPIITVDVAVTVSLKLHSHHVHSGSLVTFAGTVSPAEDGAQFAIQRQSGTQWKNVAGSSLHHSSTGSSRFSLHVRLKHSGVYRVFVGVADGAHTSNTSSAVHLTVIAKHKTHH